MSETQAFTIGYLTSAVENIIHQLSLVVANIDADMYQSAKSKTQDAIARLSMALEAVEGDN